MLCKLRYFISVKHINSTRAREIHFRPCLNNEIESSYENYQRLSNKHLWNTTLPQRKLKAYNIKYKKKFDMKPKFSGTPIIKCRNEKLNHYRGQSYDKLKPLPLASNGWHLNKYKGDCFTVNLSESNPAFETEFTPTFEDLNIDTKIIELLHKIDIVEPTKIQSATIPHILAGKNTLITSETGCGKTLAYLIPIIQKIILWKEVLPRLPYNSPLAMIIVPSRDLAYQVGNVARELCRYLNLNCKTVVGGHTKSIISSSEIEEVDLLVSSLGAISKLTTWKYYHTNMCKHLVYDEADTLLDDSFNEKSVHFLRRFDVIVAGPSKPEVIPSGTLVSLVSATMPRSLPEIIDEALPLDEMVRVSTDHVHRIQPHVPQEFRRVYKDDKTTELLKIVQHDVKQKTPLMIFSNKSSTSNFISLFLNEHGVKCINLNSNMPVDVRLGRFNQFNNGVYSVLSCTDIASRGMDTCGVKHVLNYDFPRFVADYIHRCGRTGRVGSEKDCLVTSFISGRYEAELLQKIETSIRLSESLPNVNANIARMIYHNVLSKRK